MLYMIISGAVFAICALLFLVFYLKSKGKYDDYLEYVDKEEYGLKDFIPIGLAMSEVSVFAEHMPMMLRSALARHNNRVYQKILELKGPKDAEFYHYIHRGYRLAAAVLFAAGASLMGMIMAFQGSSDGMILTAGAVAALISVPFLVDSSLDDSLKKRRLSIQMEFPEFVNKLTLLVSAGMTISKAWEKIINENKRKHILYDEMRYALAQIRAGKPEGIAYEEFARRCHVKEVTKFVSVIVMNLKHGGSDVVPVLREQGNECWEMRKNAAKELGEQAGTKILIPMMIMFLGIVLIVVTPAVLSMTMGM